VSDIATHLVPASRCSSGPLAAVGPVKCNRHPGGNEALKQTCAIKTRGDVVHEAQAVGSGCTGFHTASLRGDPEPPLMSAATGRNHTIGRSRCFTRPQMARACLERSAPTPRHTLLLSAPVHRHGARPFDRAQYWPGSWPVQPSQQRGLELPPGVDFPMFGFKQRGNRLEALHHPFCAPNPLTLHDRPAGLRPLPKRRAQPTDPWCSTALELAAGSLRIHGFGPAAPGAADIGLPRKEANAVSDSCWRRLDLGPPPHGGIALGLRSMVMLLAGEESIRDTIAFPKTQRPAALLNHSAPADVACLSTPGICNVASTWSDRRIDPELQEISGISVL